MKKLYRSLVCLALAALLFSGSAASAYDIIVTLKSNTNLYSDGGSYITLQITEPTGEVCSYWNDVTAIEGWMELTSDHERYRLASAMAGYYYIEVIASSALVGNTDVAAQVSVVLYEGTADETILIYEKFMFSSEKKQVGAFKMPEAVKAAWGISEEDGCFIASAAYGTKMAGEVISLSNFRDGYLRKSAFGRNMTSMYYKASPAIADAVNESPALAALVRTHLKPFVKIARLLSAE